MACSACSKEDVADVSLAEEKQNQLTADAKRCMVDRTVDGM
jgi:hypothetical protein